MGYVAAYVILGLPVFALYWLPTIVAWRRRLDHTMTVAVINGFLGWTVIAWVAALAMACRSKHVAQHS